MIVQPQSSVKVFASECSTVMPPPQLSLYKSATASLLNKPLILASSKQLFCSVIFDGHVPVKAGAVLSEPLTLIVLVTLLPHASVMVYVLVTVHPQLLPIVVLLEETVISVQSV